MNAQMWEYLKYGLWFLFGSGLVIEIAPIKWSPVSSFLGWMGKKLNREVENKITQIETKVDKVQMDLQDHKVESQRRDILDFASQLMANEHKTKENFDNIIYLHDKYIRYIEEKHLENGQVDLAFDYISKRYQECMEKNSFYVGR